VPAGLLANPGALQRVLVGGEDLPRALWATLATASRPLFFNVYGPTECTVDAVAAEVRLGDGCPVVGRPLPNVRIHLLDASLGAVPLGAAGELCIGGAGVSRGYLGRPAQTAERFVPDRWSAVPGERLYRSGDLARWLPDGTLVLLGRVDRQVKVRGFRVELGEIEAVLGEHPRVREAVVLALGEDAARRLVAYVAHGNEPTPEADDLRSSLKKKLPDYMVPSAFLPLAALPRTRNGKVDRSALLALELVGEKAEPVLPRNPVEEVLSGMMTEVLGIDRLGIHDNFFERGGNSIRVTELVSMVREAFGVEVPLFHVFDTPTVAGLADALLEDPEQRLRMETAAPVLLEFAARAAAAGEGGQA
jgi:acyl carrier protein